MLMILRLLIPAFIVFCTIGAEAQNTIGIPAIVNYSKQSYGAGSQNWAIAQDARGIMYFANNNGLLSFDGTFWRKYALPNKTIVRSVAVDGKRVYVGGQAEFGYFEPAANGELVYTSLMNLLPQTAQDFTDVWNICMYEGKVFFRAYRKILELSENRIRVHNGIHWNFLGVSSQGLLAYEYDRGLVRYDRGKWTPALSDTTGLPKLAIKAAVTLSPDSTLLATLSNGLFIYHHQQLSRFRSEAIDAVTGQIIFGAQALKGGHIALITNLSGCLIIDRQGKFVQRLSKKEGVQNNNVLSLMIDRDENLWLGLDNGIDLVLYNNAIKTIFPESEDRNAGYASIVYKDRLYLGLSTGAFTIPLAKLPDLSYTNGNFQAVEGSKGQVWNFAAVNDKLLMCHNNGAFLINGSTTEAIDGKTGFWDFQPLRSKDNTPVVIAGTYNGINFYRYDNGSFVNPKLHAHFESARFVVQHKEKIWIAHPYKGLYQVSYSSEGRTEVAAYTDRLGVLSSNHNKIFPVAGKMILTSDKGIFEFDDGRNDFVHSSEWEDLLGGPVSYLKEDRYGNIWFTRDRKLGVVDRMGGKQRIVLIPELNNKIQGDGFENLLVIDSNNVLIAAEKGFFHLNYADYKKNRLKLNVLIRRVNAIASGDSLIEGGYNVKPLVNSLPYRLHSLHFEASSTLYGQEHTIEYSYFLEGFDEGWSDWVKKTEKDYTNLPPGKYVFRVKCRNNTDNESEAVSYAFRILPPWYRTWWAWSLYILAGAAVLFYLYKQQQLRYKRQQAQKLAQQKRLHEEAQERDRIQHQLELYQSQQQIAELKSQQLQLEVNHKNSELASSAMNLVHKAEILSRIKSDLVQFRETTGIEKGSREFQKIIKLLDGELNQAEEWEQFARHFDHVHTDYLKRLKEICPDLTLSELKLAAYLRLSLSTKEIAQLMNISIRGVETSRYRLRKKLGLTNEEANLYEYLVQITSLPDATRTGNSQPT